MALGGIFGGIQDAIIQNLGIENGIIQAYGNEAYDSCTQLGGIVGGTIGTVKISNCYNKNVQLNYKNKSWRMAGIISCCLQGTLTIENCYNVTQLEEDGAGILAEVESGATANVLNCYTIGICDNSTSNIQSGICTLVDGVANIENCYTVPFENGTIPEVEGVTVLDLEDMKGIASNLGSAFKADTQNINDGYPILIWQ